MKTFIMLLVIFGFLLIAAALISTGNIFLILIGLFIAGSTL